MEIALIVAAAVAAVVTLLVAVPPLVFRALAGPLQQRIAAAIPAERIVLQDLRANSLGRESWGVAQRRGNGALVLTRDALHFFQAVPRRDLRIPLDSITEVGTALAHLGKTYGRELLRVAFRAENGDDSVAWLVTDLPAWRAKLGELVPR